MTGNQSSSLPQRAVALSPARKGSFPSLQAIGSPSEGQSRAQSIMQSHRSGVSYGLLATDEEKSKQLMKLFDKRLKNIDAQHHLIERINQQPDQSELEQAVEAVQIQQELRGKAGLGNSKAVSPIKVSSKQQMAHEKVRDGYYKGEYTVAQAHHDIADQVHQHQRTQQEERSYFRDILNDIHRHRKALQLINEIEDQIRKNHGDQKMNLTVDEDKLPNPSRLTDTPTESGPASRLLAMHRKKKQTFQERYDYERYENSEEDSDKQEEKAYREVGGRKDMASVVAGQRKRQSPSGSPRGSPRAIQTPRAIPPFKGTKFDDKISSPKNAGQVEGSVALLHSLEAKEKLISERKHVVEGRLQRKKEFREDVDKVINDPGLARDLLHYDHEKGELVNKPQQLDHWQTKQIRKEEFEVKISQMSELIQPELDETGQKLNLPESLFKPDPTYKDILNNEKVKRQKLYEKNIRTTSNKSMGSLNSTAKSKTGGGMTSSAGQTGQNKGPDVTPQEGGPGKARFVNAQEDEPDEPALGKKKTVRIVVDQSDRTAEEAEEASEADPHAKYEVTVDASSVSITEPGTRQPESPGSPTSQGSSTSAKEPQPSGPKDSKLQRPGDKKAKGVRMLSLSKKHRMKKDAEKAEKRKMLGLASDEELSSSAQSEEESFEQKKDRARRARLNELRLMNTEERKSALASRTTTSVDLPPEEELRQAKMEVFLNRISKDEEFPVSTIQNLVVIKMKEFEDKNKNKYTNSNMAKFFAEDDVITGLCLLQCLKKGEIRQNKQNQEMILQNTKAILKAVKTVKSFQEKEVYQDESNAAADLTELLRAQKSAQTGGGGNAAKAAEAQSKLAKKNEKRNEFFNTSFFQKVIGTIVGDSDVSTRQLQSQITKQLEAQIDDKQGMEKELAGLQAMMKEKERLRAQAADPEAAEGDEDYRLKDLDVEIRKQEEVVRQKVKQNMMNYAGVKRADQSVQLFARKINLQNEFNQVCKYAANPRIEEDFGKNPMMQYFQKSNKDAFLPLPILSRISNKTLPLVSYRLTEGQCLGLGDAMAANPRILTGVVLDNNGMADPCLSTLLQGLHKLEHVKSIIYRNNELQSKSIENIIPLLARKKPQNLQELRIVSCRIGGNITAELIDQLLEQSSLAKLSLVEASISEDSFRNLCKYIEGSRSLREIDISFNDIRLKLMKVLIDVLGKDRQLASVNLSWNCLQSPEPTQIDSMVADSRRRKRSPNTTGGQLSALQQTLQMIPEEIEEKDGRSSRTTRKSKLGEREEEQSVRKSAQSKLTEGTQGRQSRQQKGQSASVNADLHQVTGAGFSNDASGTNGEDAQQVPAASPGASLQDKPEEEIVYAEAETAEDRAAGSEAEAMKKAQEKANKKFNKELWENLCKFIKYNQNLQHFDLRHTGLNETSINKIGTALAKARSVLCLHLGGNPGLSDRNLEYLFTRLRCKRPQQPKITEDLNAWVDEHREDHEKNLSIEDIKKKHDNLKPQRKRELIQENLKLQHIKRSMKVHKHSITMAAPDERKLSFVRFLGHKCDIPGSAQWQMFSDPFNTLQTCWVCDQWIYSLVFWTRSIGEAHGQDYKRISWDSREQVVEKILEKHPFVEPLNPDNPKDVVAGRRLKQMTFYEEDEGRPLICGEFTNWQPMRMIRIDEFAQSIDSETARAGLGWVDLLQRKGRIPKAPASKDFRDLDDDGQAEYLQLRQEMMENYNKNWYESLSDELYYKKPHMANGEYLSTIQHPQEEQLYVFPCFIRPGKQQYVVIQEDGLANKTDVEMELPTDEASYYFHKSIVENREEEPKPFSKPMRVVKKAREFKHETSVFKEWKQDAGVVLDRCFDHDSTYWKLSRFIKDPEQLERTRAILRRAFPHLKNIFHYLIAKSSFPAIGWLDFAAWAEKIKVPDERTCPSSAIDRAFIAANIEAERTDGNNNPDAALCRYEFLEIVVRVAKAKYFESGVTKSVPDAVTMLLTQNIEKYDDCGDEWAGWRRRELYTVPVNDLLEPNKNNLKKLYESFFGLSKKSMDIRDCFDLFMKRTSILAKEEYVTYCFGMAKQTVVQETKDAERRYSAMTLSEFLEMVGRVAHFRYSASAGDEYATTPLAQKIEWILDEIFATINVKRKDPEVVIEDESESDDDY